MKDTKTSIFRCVLGAVAFMWLDYPLDAAMKEVEKIEGQLRLVGSSFNQRLVVSNKGKDQDLCKLNASLKELKKLSGMFVEVEGKWKGSNIKFGKPCFSKSVLSVLSFQDGSKATQGVLQIKGEKLLFLDKESRVFPLREYSETLKKYVGKSILADVQIIESSDKDKYYKILKYFVYP